MFFKALIISFLCFFCSSPGCFAQHPQVTGTDVPFPSRAQRIHKYVGKIDDNYIFIRRGKKQSVVSLEVYNRNFDLISQNEIPQVEEEKVYEMLWDVVLVRKKLYAVYTKVQKSGEQYGVTRTVEIAGLSQEASLTNRKVLATLPNTSVVEYGNYHLTFSADSSVGLLGWLTKEKDAEAKVSMVLFDHNFSGLQEKEVTLSKQTSRLADIKPDNNKGVYISTRARILKEDGKAAPWYKYEFYVFKEEELKAVDFKLGTAFLSDMKFIVTSDGVRGAGLMSDGNSTFVPKNHRFNSYEVNNEYLTQGMLYFWLDAGQEISIIQKNKWDENTMAEFSYRGNKDGAGGVPFLRIRNLLQTPAKDLVAISELSFTYGRKSMDPKDSPILLLECGPVYIDRISRSGSGSSLSAIAKWQTTPEFITSFNSGEVSLKTVNYVAVEGGYPDLHFGIQTFLVGENVHVIYNDHVKNFGNQANVVDKVVKYPGKGEHNTMLATAGPDGKLRTDVLFSSKDKITRTTPIPMFMNSVGMTGREVLLYGHTPGKASGFIRIKF